MYSWVPRSHVLRGAATRLEVVEHLDPVDDLVVLGDHRFCRMLLKWCTNPNEHEMSHALKSLLDTAADAVSAPIGGSGAVRGWQRAQ